MGARWWLPTDAWVRWLLVPAAVFIALASNQTHLADFWHHLARGRAIVEEGRLLDHDVFTFTVPGREFQDVNWLTQVLYYFGYSWGGLGLVRTANALLVAATLAWLVSLCRRAGGSLPIAMGLGIAVFLGLWHVLTIRPQSLSLLLFIAMLDILDRSKRNPKLLVLPPLLMIVWANVHGAFPAGIMLVGCFWLTALWKKGRGRPSALWPLTACLAAACLATLVNPYGWGIYRYVLGTSSISANRRIDEWVPPNFSQMIGIAFFVSLAVLGGLLALAWKKPILKLSTREAVLLVCFLPLAAGSVRMVAWWLLILAPIAARRLAALWPERSSAQSLQPNFGAAVCVAALSLTAMFSLPGLQRYNPLLALRPADLTLQNLEEARRDLARRLPEGNVFARFEWAEYLDWASHPAHKVFMDGRIEIFPDDVWNAYAVVTRGQEGWSQILDRYQVDALILDRDYHGRTGLLSKVEASPRWQRQFQSDTAVVYLRGEPQAHR